MKTLTMLAALVILTILTTTGCESRTERHVTPAGATETTTVTTPSVDTAAAEETARDAAHETGTAVEQAGEEIQQQTKTD